MKKSLVSGCIGLVVTSLLLLAGCSNPAVVDPNNYSISGTVTVDAGMDVSQASVELWQGGAKATGPIQPDSSGKFSFPDVHRGDAYIVKINMGSTASWTSGSISVPNAPRLKAVLTQTKFTIKGTVSSDFADAVITNAKLVLLLAGEEIAETSPASGGAYEFAKLSAGTYFIRTSLALHDTIFSPDFEIASADISGKDFVLHRDLPELQKVTLKGSDLHLVWNQSVIIADGKGFSLGGTDSTKPDITFTGATIVPGKDSKEWLLALSRAPEKSETVTLAYDNKVGAVAHTQDGAKPASFSGRAVSPPFSIVSAELDLVSGTPALTLVFNADANGSTLGGQISPGGLPSGLELRFGATQYSGVTIYRDASDSNTKTLYLYNGVSGVDSTTVLTLSYSGNIITSFDGEALSAFNNFPVTALLPPTYTVKGTVSANIAGADLTTASVWLMRGNKEIAKKTPLANGSYEFTGVNVGNGYYVQAGMDLYQTKDSSVFDITDKAVNVAEIALQRILPALQKATVKGDNLHLVWSQSVNMPSEAGFSLNSDASTITVTSTIGAVAGKDNKEWNITLSRATDAVETITLSYDNGTGTVAHQDGTKPASITGKGFAVTNGNAIAAFNIVSAEINSKGLTNMTLTFSGDVDTTSLNNAFGNSLALYCDATKFSGTSMMILAEKSTVIFAFPLGISGANSSTVFTLSYSGGTIMSAGGDALPDFSNFAVTNNL